MAVKYHARTGINSRQDYERLYEWSIRDPAGFWADLARQFHWETPVCAMHTCMYHSACLNALWRHA